MLHLQHLQFTTTLDKYGNKRYLAISQLALVVKLDSVSFAVKPQPTLPLSL
jgi:hypothetical protein